MKTKKLVLILPFLFLIIGIEACGDKEPRFEIYENHEISACGVDDPLRNLDWLAEFTAKIPAYNDNDYVIRRDISLYNVMIELYGNTETPEEHIVIFVSSNRQGGLYRTLAPYESKQAYTCSGERLGREEWEKFFHSRTNQSQGIIWYRRRIE